MNKVQLSMALLLATLAVGQASAQLDYTPPDQQILLYESGYLVGQIYVPERDPNARRYLEHWVLFPNYHYPGRRFINSLLVAPVQGSGYSNEAEFFEKVEFPERSKYIEVTVEEFDALPSPAIPVVP